MAVRWNWKAKMGKMVIKQKRGDKVLKFTNNIYEGNCLAVFIHEFKDEEIKKEKYEFIGWFNDERHCKNIIKDNGRLFFDDVASIELNLWFSDAKKLLNILVKNGYKVKCYYKELKL